MSFKKSYLFKNTIMLFLGFATVWAQPTPSNWYPRNGNTHWGYTGFSNGYISGLTKDVMTNGSTIVAKSVFSAISLQGVQINGTNYQLSALTKVSETVTNQGTYLQFLGSYTRGPDHINIDFRFNQDASFTLKTDIVTTTGGTKKAYVRMDYDIDGPGNNIYQFATAGSTYYWDSNDKEMTKSYPGIFLYTSNVIERNAWCRLANAIDPQNQDFVVLYPASGSTGPAVDLTFMGYNTDPRTIPPAPNTTQSIQTTFNDAAQPGRYPTVGTDQVAYLGLTLPSVGSNTFSATAGGKFFPKPNGRPLRVNFYSQTGTLTPDPTTIVTGTNSLGSAMNSLTNSHTIYSYFSNQASTQISEPCPWLNSIQCLTSAKLHQQMLDWRSANSAYAYSQTNRDNFRDFSVDLLTVNYDWYNANATGLMFDETAYDNKGNDANNTPAECGVNFYPRMAHAWPKVGNWPADATPAQLVAFSAGHEIAHALGMHHWWAQCTPTAGAPIYYLGYQSACADYVTTNTLHSLEDGNIWGTTMSYNPQFIQWYQQGPESWVKPGRYRGTWNAKRRNFTQTGTTGTILPNNPAWTTD